MTRQVARAKLPWAPDLHSEARDCSTFPKWAFFFSFVALFRCVLACLETTFCWLLVHFCQTLTLTELEPSVTGTWRSYTTRHSQLVIMYGYDPFRLVFQMFDAPISIFTSIAPLHARCSLNIPPLSPFSQAGQTSLRLSSHRKPQAHYQSQVYSSPFVCALLLPLRRYCT